MFRNKDIKYIESVLNDLAITCKKRNSCRLCKLTDFCADRPFTGITSYDFYRNRCDTAIMVTKNNGKVCLVSLEKFLEYLHKNCAEERDKHGCGACPLKDHCDNTLCFTTTPSEWDI